MNELLELNVFADVIAHYNEYGRFDEMTQKTFMRILCNELLKGPRLSNETISQISNDVCLTFVTEKKVEHVTNDKNIIEFFHLLDAVLRQTARAESNGYIF